MAACWWSRAGAGTRASWALPPRASRSASTCRASCWRRTRRGSSPRAPAGRSPASTSARAVREAFESGLIEKGGGHAMAAGLTVQKERLGDLRGFLEERLGPQVQGAQDRALSIDAALTAGAATLELIELLEQAGPYGTAHPSPVFAFPAHRVLYADRAGGDHIRCTIASADGKKLKAVAFRAMGTELGELLLSEQPDTAAYCRPADHRRLVRRARSLPPHRRCRTRFVRLAKAAEPPYRAATRKQGALRLSVRTTAFHVVKTGSTPVGRAILSMPQSVASSPRDEVIGSVHSPRMAIDAERPRKLAVSDRCGQHVTADRLRIVQEIATIGEASVRRIYGDFSATRAEGMGRNRHARNHAASELCQRCRRRVRHRPGD